MNIHQQLQTHTPNLHGIPGIGSLTTTGAAEVETEVDKAKKAVQKHNKIKESLLKHISHHHHYSKETICEFKISLTSSNSYLNWVMHL